MPSIYNNTILVAITITGLVYLLIDHELSLIQVLSYSFFLAVVVLILLIVIYGFRHPAVVDRLITGNISRLMQLLKRKYNPTRIQKPVDNLFAGLELLRKQGRVRPVIGAAMNIGFDMLTLYILFIAAGQVASPAVLMAGYGLAFLLGKAAFMVPGGVGVIEGSMAATYTHLGIPAPVSVVVILSYRLFSFWIPNLLGFIFMAYLKRS